MRSMEQPALPHVSYGASLPGRRNARTSLPQVPEGLRRQSTLRRRSSRQSAESSRTARFSSMCSSDTLESTAFERGLPDVLEQVRAAIAEVAQDGDSNTLRMVREARYAEALASHPGLEDTALRPSDEEGADARDSLVKEVAGVFAEFDASLTGFIPPHEVRTVLMHLGRQVSSKNLYELLDVVHEGKDGIMRNYDLDFLDVVDVVGHQVALDQATLRRGILQFRGLERPPELREVASVLEGVGLHPRLEQLRKLATELKLVSRINGTVEFTHAAQLFRMAECCRMIEKQRFKHRAGFSHDQVCVFQAAFEQVAGSPEGELDKEGLFLVLEEIHAMPENQEDVQDLEELLVHADRDGNGKYSFEECLHLVRRFHDKEDFNTFVCEIDAAQEVGLNQEELQNLRSLYTTLSEEDVRLQEFSYFALTKAVRMILGISITMEKNAALQAVFREHATPSKAPRKRQPPSPRVDPSGIESLQLPFPGFLRVMGRLRGGPEALAR